MTANEIESAVSAYLAEIGVTYRAAYQGEKKNALGGTTTMDKWSCDFTTAARPNEPEEFEFFTGLGLRHQATVDTRLRAARGYQGLTAGDKAGKTSYGRRYLATVESLRKPKEPCAAEVLHSLILDSSASGQSFVSWCDEYGYDSDSRKALATYEACQENADKLGRVLTHAQREHLGELLQDY